MIYLTYNDQPSGVYSSQVSDVCNFLNNNFDAKIRLVAFISLHDFAKYRKVIHKDVPGAIVLPALPKAKYWKFSAFVFALICLFTGERKVIARNVIATHLALIGKKIGVVNKICMDGRGAIGAEWNEYHVVPDEVMKKAILGQEKEAVLNSDFHIAVSTKLVDYWREAFGYTGNNHVIIPCTLNSKYNFKSLSEDIIKKQRALEGFEDSDIVMVYSGSTAGWQSLDVLGKVLGKVLSDGKQFKLLFLSKGDKTITVLKEMFPGQVINKWIPYQDVRQVLLACDYGILYRENSVTNQVASPTKFAEYLSSGLPVIISENLGDYTEFVRKENCGFIISGYDTLKLHKPLHEEKRKAFELAEKHFTKEANRKQYETLLAFFNK
jgi:glycosyltransferase involved in cell wall biosynthesis